MVSACRVNSEEEACRLESAAAASTFDVPSPLECRVDRIINRGFGSGDDGCAYGVEAVAAGRVEAAGMAARLRDGAAAGRVEFLFVNMSGSCSSIFFPMNYNCNCWASWA
jgi:hypothetical protein